MIGPEIFQEQSCLMTVLFQIVSKAFVRSKNTASTCSWRENEMYDSKRESK